MHKYLLDVNLEIKKNQGNQSLNPLLFLMEPGGSGTKYRFCLWLFG